MKRRSFCAAVASLPAAPAFAASSWKAGAAKICITPRTSLPMAGFGDRKKPSEGVGLDIYTRALALEDQSGKRCVLVTAEIAGFSAAFHKAIADRIQAQYGIARDCLVLNVSHTHSGPVASKTADRYPAQVRADVAAYAQELEDKVVEVAGTALKDCTPARLTFRQTSASFGVNRRQNEGRKWGPNYLGPADHDVPILQVDSESGELRALMFGFGCHPSSLLPQNCKIHGDYAGVAAKSLEDRHRGTVALFVQGAGGDVKPYPSGTVELTEKYGEMLAAGVEAQLQAGNITLEPASESVTVSGPLTTTFETFPLAFDVPSREQLREQAEKGKPFERSHATRMLAILDRDGRLPSDYPYPLAVWQFGRDLTLVAMGGEVLSDYALRLKREFSGSKLWVAGYCHESFGYIPSRRVRNEGGYEGRDVMLYGGHPGPWAPQLEETIVAKVHELVTRVQGH